MTHPTKQEEICGHTWTYTGVSCELPKGHDGLHSGRGGSWVTETGTFPSSQQCACGEPDKRGTHGPTICEHYPGVGGHMALSEPRLPTSNQCTHYNSDASSGTGTTTLTACPWCEIEGLRAELAQLRNPDWPKQPIEVGDMPEALLLQLSAKRLVPEITRLRAELAEVRKGEALSDRIALHWQTTAERLQGELQASDQAEANAFRNRDSAIQENERLRAALEQIRDKRIIQGISPDLFAYRVLAGSAVETSTAPVPFGWARAVTSPGGPWGPPEHDWEAYVGDDPPTSEAGWLPFYREAQVGLANAQEWHRLCEAIATILEVDSNADRDGMGKQIADAIQALRDERWKALQALSRLRGIANTCIAREPTSGMMRSALEQIDGSSAQETSPPHPGPSIERAFARSPRRIQQWSIIRDSSDPERIGLELCVYCQATRRPERCGQYKGASRCTRLEGHPGRCVFHEPTDCPEVAAVPHPGSASIADAANVGSIPAGAAPEPNDPALDGFMRLEDVVQHMASGWRLGHEDGDYFVTQTAGRVRSDTISRLLDEGWIEGRNTCYILTDAGRKAYLRSTDELGDGKLVAPSEKASPKPAMVICNKPTPDGPCLNDAGHDGDCDGIPY